MRRSLAELEARCQKPEHRRIGNWMARRVARPAALRITWLIAPYGVTAHAATLLAWAVGLAAVAQFAIGTPDAWLGAAITLQLWYLFDHVDGQLARLHGTASLDGVQLDYLMHHSLNLLVPVGLGYGIARAAASDVWLAAGIIAGATALLIGLLPDTRYKAFVQRLKRVRGELRVTGGGGARPTPQPALPSRPAHFARWALQKLSEPHVVMNLATFVACAAFVVEDARLTLGAALVATLATANAATLAARVWRSMHAHSAETEFADWFKPRLDEQLTFEEGWWIVRHVKNGEPETPKR